MGKEFRVDTVNRLPSGTLPGFHQRVNKKLTAKPLRGVKIEISPHLPLIEQTHLDDEQLGKIVSFCRRKKRESPAPQSAPSHARATQAIETAAFDIYQSFFLTKIDTPDRIYAFSEMGLDGAHVDCLILGPFGAILVEVKPPRSSAGKQLDRYERKWHELFPEVPSLTVTARVKGNRITLWQHGY